MSSCLANCAPFWRYHEKTFRVQTFRSISGRLGFFPTKRKVFPWSLPRGLRFGILFVIFRWSLWKSKFGGYGYFRVWYFWTANLSNLWNWCLIEVIRSIMKLFVKWISHLNIIEKLPPNWWIKLRELIGKLLKEISNFG